MLGKASLSCNKFAVHVNRSIFSLEVSCLSFLALYLSIIISLFALNLVPLYYIILGP